MQKIDIHCHTTRSILQNIIPVSAHLETIENEMRVHNIEYTFVLASYFPKQGKGISNYRLLHWIRSKPSFKLIGSLDYQSYYAAGIRELTELAEEGYLAGIKIYSGYQQIDYASKEFASIAKLAEHYQLPLMFHGGFLQCHESDIKLALEPKQLASIAQRFPQVSIIISHLAWPFVDELIDLVKQHNNVFADMSGMIDSFKTAHTLHECVLGLKKYLESCGSSRLLFGTDFPVQTHADSIRLIELAMMDYSSTDRTQVYYTNAKRMFHIK